MLTRAPTRLYPSCPLQSAALRMICERDDEISAHVPVEYWSVSADVEAGGHSFEGASLVALGEEKLGKVSQNGGRLQDDNRIAADPLACDDHETVLSGHGGGRGEG